MRFVAYLNVISLGIHLTGGGEANVYTNEAFFFPLIKRIRNYYSTSAVFFVQSNDGHKDVDGTNLKQFPFKYEISHISSFN